MPTYEYRCKECGERLEVVQSFTDDPLTECPACTGPLRKVFGNIGITFKGSGFYKTDSRGGSSKPAAASDTGSKDGSSKESSTSSDSPSTSSSSDSKPKSAESKPATSSTSAA